MPVEFVLRIQPNDDDDAKFVVLSALEATTAMSRLLKCEKGATRTILSHIHDWSSAIGSGSGLLDLRKCATVVPMQQRESAGKTATSVVQRVMPLLRIFNGETRLEDWELNILSLHFGMFSDTDTKKAVSESGGADQKDKLKSNEWAAKCHRALRKNKYIDHSGMLLKKPPDPKNTQELLNWIGSDVPGLNTRRMAEGVLMALGACWDHMHPCLKRARLIKATAKLSHDALVEALQNILRARGCSQYYFGSPLMEVLGVASGQSLKPGGWEHWAPSAPSSKALPTSIPTDDKRGQSRWGEGIEAPQAGRREFFPPGWQPDPSMTLDKSMDLLGMSPSQKAEIFADAPIKLPILEVEDIQMDQEEVSHILTYTHETPAYTRLNHNMRSSGTEKVLAKLSTYISRFSGAARALPPFRGKVFRGLSTILNASAYPPEGEVCWQAYSSATKDIHQTLRFLVKDGHRLSGTIVIIDSQTGHQLELISQYPHEEEVLFLENTFFKVLGWHADEEQKRAALPQLAGYDIKHVAVLELKEMAKET
eukprot:TRINITY_DN73944_c0_g1_i1.p1 TRINITY_DN73944_c0_g1~~TRINITY_DN73944_c0_g1_i1.p1  ORF type:complete len:617 (+),score=111.11 TRINITY_DN73944_c0_g1_i1:242-1852(+)